ncbi:hypothetical protein AAC387_Pa02g1302 [Persea americana]
MRKVEQLSKNIAKESVRLEHVKKPVEKRVRMDEARKVDREEGEDAMLKTRDIVKSGKVIRKRRKQMREAEQLLKNIAKERVRLEDVKKPVEKRVRMDGARKVDREEGEDARLKTRNIVQSGKVKRKRRKQMREAAQRSKKVAKERVRLEDVKQPVEKRVRMDEARKVDTIMRKMFEDVRDEIFTFLSMKEKEMTNELDSILRTHSALSST